jgi:formamidopyrimidine-DNA glycosylase
MPELPEVEAVARALRPLVRGRQIRCLHVFHAIAFKPQAAAEIARRVEGRGVQEVFRRGKSLFLALDRGLVEMHFRLDSQLIWFSGAKELPKNANLGENGVHEGIPASTRLVWQASATFIRAKRYGTRASIRGNPQTCWTAANPRSSIKRLCPFSGVL